MLLMLLIDYLERAFDVISLLFFSCHHQQIVIHDQSTSHCKGTIVTQRDPTQVSHTPSPDAHHLARTVARSRGDLSALSTKKRSSDYRKPVGRREGLMNMGNTCYINACLQVCARVY